MVGNITICKYHDVLYPLELIFAPQGITGHICFVAPSIKAAAPFHGKHEINEHCLALSNTSAALSEEAIDSVPSAASFYPINACQAHSFLISSPGNENLE